jgi:hypothetical protein
MARTKKPSQRVKDNLACLVASQTTAPVDQGSTQTNGDQSQPANATQSSSSKTTAYVWTQPTELFLIDELNAAIRRGERLENGFHPRIWDRIVGRFLEEGHDPITRTQLRSKHDSVCPSRYGYKFLANRLQWKAKWKAFEQLLDQSGWSVNDAGDLLLADDEAWERAIAKWASNARQFRGKPFKYAPTQSLKYG